MYNRLFSSARRKRKRAILMDFEEELVDKTHRAFVNQIRQKVMWRSVAVFLFIFLMGSISPNFLSFDANGLRYEEAQADFEEEYTESVLLSIDGFLTKTYTPTENSTGVKGIYTVTVEEGDTLSGIAYRHGVKASDIAINNNLSQYQIRHLKPGTELRIANGVIHKVGKKETIKSIAKIYGVEGDKILKENEVLASEVEQGMELVIAGSKKSIPRYSTPPRGGGYTASAPQYSGSPGSLYFPTRGRYTQYFRRGHYAVDIASNQSPPIYAAESGVVEKAQCGWNGGYGCHIVINHGNGMKTLYAHLRRIDSTVGENVAKGQIIAIMGNSGRVYGKTGIHLHFEVIIDGIKRNPIAYF